MSGLYKATRAVGGMTTISRVFGLIRDVILARAFGAGAGFDVFIVVFRIPNFLRRLSAEGGFSQAFIPVLAEYKQTRSHTEVQALIDQTAATLGLALLAITAVGVFGAPILITVFAPGFMGDEGKYELAAKMLQITFPYIFFISLTAFAGAILNCWRSFSVPAFTPVLLNLSLIGCAIWLAPLYPPEQQVVALAWGVFIAGVVQLLFQFPFLMKLDLMPRPRFGRDSAGVMRVFKLMVPILFAVSITQINLLVDTLIASFLQEGSISWLYYSDRLVEFPLGVFGVALATVILPHLSAEHANGDRAQYGRILSWAIGMVFLIAVPATAGLVILSQPLLATLFHYSEFSSHDVIMSGRSLAAFACGLPAFILVKILSTAFFSRQDTKTPVKVAVVALISNIVLNLLLMVPLGHAGLALATSLAAYINAGLLYHLLKKHGHYVTEPGLGRLLIRVTIGVAGMSLLLLLLVQPIESWFVWNVYQRVPWVIVWTCGGALTYFAMLWIAGLRKSDLKAPA